MATRMNSSSPTERGTPVVVREDGEERDTVQSVAQTDTDPAPADLDENHRRRLFAYEAGKQAKAAGFGRGEMVCWLAGYDGEPMPEFKEQDHG